MNFKGLFNFYENEINGIVIGLLVIIGTFPINNFSFSAGIDPPLAWAFSHISSNGFALGRHIIFPHGPLAFFMYPIEDNMLIATLMVALFKLLIVFNVSNLLKEDGSQKKWVFTFLFAYAFSLLASFNHLLLVNILLLYCNYYYKRKYFIKLTAFVLTAFAFYVKAYVSIISGVLFVSFALYFLIYHKGFRTLIIDSLVLFVLILSLWLFLYGSPVGFPRYIWGIFQLAQDNSSAAAWYPYNNWFVLLTFLLLTALVFVVNRSKETTFYSFLVALSLFAAWKHGMAREDFSHVRGLFIYTIACLSVFLIFNPKRLVITFLIAFSSILLFTVNMKNSVNYSIHRQELFGTNNFIEFFTDFSNIKRNAKSTSQKNIAKNKLPESFIERIGNSSTDVYPWDYSIVAANNLTWQPRVVLHSYASYTTWLDKENSAHFLSSSAPEFIIFENTTWSNVNGGNISSIDGRYFMNDEPNTILSILSNYRFVDSQSKLLLLQKRDNRLLYKVEELLGSTYNWGQWIKVPDFEQGILRARLSFKKTIMQSLKSFFYKDEQFWIYKKLTDGSIHKYRIVPKNARDGLWINPYIYSSDEAFRVQEIMFVCSNRKILIDQIKVDWDFILFENESNLALDVFGIDSVISYSTFYSSINDFEGDDTQNWSIQRNHRTTNDSFSGRSSFCLNRSSFSETFSLAIDNSFPEEFTVETECWIKPLNYRLSRNITFIISFEDENGVFSWNGINIDEQIVDSNQWNHVFHRLIFTKNKNCTLKVYFWNRSNQDILLDGFKVTLKAIR